jgi:hypothetical protein
MLTEKLYIKSISHPDILKQIISEYTHLFYKSYNNLELLEDKDFIEASCKGYIDKSIYDFAKKDVLSKYKKFVKDQEKKKKQIIELEEYLYDSENFKTKKELKVKYKLINKLATLKRNLGKNITFGGKELLRSITTISQRQEKTKEDLALLEKYKKEFTKKRKVGLYLIGRACEGGNRKIDFDINNKRIILKVNRDTHIEISLTGYGKKQKKLIEKLQNCADNDLTPLTVIITETHVHISYDEEFIHGYAFNDIDCKKEQKLHDDKEKKKEIYIKYKKEQEERKSIGKIKNRYLSVDLNPQYIGYTIFDKTEDGEQKFIVTEYIDLTRLSYNHKLASHDLKKIKQNNKRKYEIKEAWKYIFELAKHYKVSHFVMEDLDFSKNKFKDNLFSKEFNKKKNNLWYRTLTVQLINKWCNILGLLLNDKVVPSYSSFIGNMVYSFPDPVSAAAEIGRRGMSMYIKGYSIYPDLERINQEKLTYLLGENLSEKGTSWKQLYVIISSLRYRNPLKYDGLIVKNLYSNKSKVKVCS